MIYVWEHSDSRGLDAARASASSRALASAWQDGPKPEAIADFRMMILRAAMQAACLSKALPFSRSSDRLDIPDPSGQFSSKARETQARGLWLAFDPIFEQAKTDFPGNVATSIATLNGDPAVAIATPEGAAAGEGGDDAGAVWMVVGVVATALAFGAVAVFCSQRAAEILDRYLARASTFTSLFKAQESLLLASEKRSAAEKAAGKELPITDAEKEALKTVGALRATASQQAQTPISNPLPDMPSLPSFSFGLGFAAIAAGALYFITRQK